VEGTDRLDLLTSQNSAFRPVDVAFGFDAGCTSRILRAGLLGMPSIRCAIRSGTTHAAESGVWSPRIGRL